MDRRLDEWTQFAVNFVLQAFMDPAENPHYHLL
jgi:hypothetical protein